MYDEVSAQFGEFGPIEDVSVHHVGSRSCTSSLRFGGAHRAKRGDVGQAALMAFPTSSSSWANDDPNPIAIVRVANETEEKVRDMFLRSEKAQTMMREAKRQMMGQGKRQGRHRDDKKKDVEISFDPADYDEDEDEDEAARNPKP